MNAVFGADESIPLFGQAGRQVFFIIMSIYGWWRWSQLRRMHHADDPRGVAI
ncbi:MAG: nicotinamide mononucleotide transporter, partial [Humibacillus sp.]